MNDSFINSIINHLKNKRIGNEMDNSLWYGKSGYAILNYLLYKHTREVRFSEQAISLLNNVSDNIASVKEMGFERGLTGIGWTIEWAAQNNFLDVNTDEILEDIDSVIYKSIMFSPDENFFMSNGTLSKLAYFTKRYQSANIESHRFKRIYQQECLVILTDELYDNLIGESNNLKIELATADNNTLINIGHLLTFLSKFSQMKINEPTVEKTLYGLINDVDNFLKSECYKFTSRNIQVNYEYYTILQYLAVSYLFAGKYHNHDYWQKEASAIMWQLLNFENKIGLGNENALRRIMVYALLNAYSFSPIYETKISEILETINLALLSNKAIYKLGIATLSLCNGKLISNWQELIEKF